MAKSVADKLLIMRPISQVAVDDIWSALRFRVLEEGEPPFSGGSG
jgi:hypothetical protein